MIIILFFFLSLEYFFLQLRTLYTFKVDDLIVFLLVFLLEFVVFPFRRVLKLFTLFQHLFEFSGHELHFIIYGSSKTIFRAIILKHLHFKSFRGALLFFYVLKMDFMNSKDTNNSSQARVFRFLASSIVVAFGSTP